MPVSARSSGGRWRGHSGAGGGGPPSRSPDGGGGPSRRACCSCSRCLPAPSVTPASLGAMPSSRACRARARRRWLSPSICLPLTVGTCPGSRCLTMSRAGDRNRPRQVRVSHPVPADHRDMMKIVEIVPAPPGWYSRWRLTRDQTMSYPVTVWALVEDMDTKTRTVVGVDSVGEFPGVDSAEPKGDFVQYAFQSPAVGMPDDIFNPVDTAATPVR